MLFQPLVGEVEVGTWRAEDVDAFEAAMLALTAKLREMLPAITSAETGPAWKVVEDIDRDGRTFQQRSLTLAESDDARVELYQHYDEPARAWVTLGDQEATSPADLSRWGLMLVTAAAERRTAVATTR